MQSRRPQSRRVELRSKSRGPAESRRAPRSALKEGAQIHAVAIPHGPRTPRPTTLATRPTGGKPNRKAYESKKTKRGLDPRRKGDPKEHDYLSPGGIMDHVTRKLNDAADRSPSRMSESWDPSANTRGGGKRGSGTGLSSMPSVRSIPPGPPPSYGHIQLGRTRVVEDSDVPARENGHEGVLCGSSIAALPPSWWSGANQDPSDPSPLRNVYYASRNLYYIIHVIAKFPFGDHERVRRVANISVIAAHCTHHIDEMMQCMLTRGCGVPLEHLKIAEIKPDKSLLSIVPPSAHKWPNKILPPTQILNTCSDGLSSLRISGPWVPCPLQLNSLAVPVIALKAETQMELRAQKQAVSQSSTSTVFRWVTQLHLGFARNVVLKEL
ncbi:hypothetical protein C8R43DRAFT_956473 [Mycena crocata]|nr:hypothetical protein C8R43DRAFT_956473 [Mycena crocata]